MNKLTAILLSSFILIQSFQISIDDIMQLDELIEHAQFHKQEYGDNFFVFLSKHYGELKAEHTEHNHKEQSDHEQLPFQCQGHYVSLLAIVQSPFQPSSDTFEISPTTEANFHYLNLYASISNTQLLQPPRQA
ncbi:hypothetical protein BWZ20_09810 [Winogradskyella sp. J14-2]|uniref:hypothetical protein n=1 Tax=Winogradskyella sp. J14-2 TaxID=1936080 RepID=UPI0009727A6F|nr:hypothetical protein [Winogradskyella sp. J14-2]APY08578.1 hypothetical protein BWZ20_09810 [Winogradskyella sp. J14-2]